MPNLCTNVNTWYGHGKITETMLKDNSKTWQIKSWLIATLMHVQFLILVITETHRSSLHLRSLYVNQNNQYKGPFTLAIFAAIGDFTAISNRPCKLLAIPRRNRAWSRSKNRQCKRALRKCWGVLNTHATDHVLIFCLKTQHWKLSSHNW